MDCLGIQTTWAWEAVVGQDDDVGEVAGRPHVLQSFDALFSRKRMIWATTASKIAFGDQ